MAAEELVAHLFLDLVIIVVAAKLVGELAERVGQSAVLGELLAGIIIGPSLLGWIPNPLAAGAGSEGEVLAFLAELGVVLLLFEVGLESDVKGLMKVGGAASLVAVFGIVFSFAFGFAASWGMARVTDLWADRTLLHVFMGATFTATSVGITARVFSDLGRIHSSESRIVLGAAVLDDIGGLIILGVVSALLAGEALTTLGISWLVVKSLGAWLLAVVVGVLVVPRIFDWLGSKFRIRGFALSFGVVVMLLAAWAATLIPMAAIVGAFAGGLVLGQAKLGHKVFEQLRPVGTLFIPIFFVLLGVMVDLRALAGDPVLVIGAVIALTTVAIAGKLLCGLGTLRTGASRYVVGVAMVPRGEVGLIFALLGLRAIEGQEPLLDDFQYGIIVAVVMLTTFVTPIWLKRLGNRFHEVAMGPLEAHKKEGTGRILEPMTGTEEPK